MRTETAFALLNRIGASETAFAAVGAEVEKAATSIMQKLLKSKNLTISGLRDTCTAVGTDIFAAVIDNLADKDVTALIKTFDKLWPELKPASSPAQREHFMALAVGRIEPTAKAAPLPKSDKTNKVERKAAWSESMSARPPRG
jgi:hypothetical protein